MILSTVVIMIEGWRSPGMPDGAVCLNTGTALR
jgi:hypothetical protein